LDFESIKHFFSFEGMQDVIKWGGVLILCAIVFAETGLLVGFCMPGDSLMIVAGFSASYQPESGGPLLNIWTILIALPVAAILGDTVGYYIGAKAGPALYNRPQSKLFRRDHLLAAKAYYEKHGGKTIIMARFVPIIRTFAPTVAGVAQMEYRRFLSFNVIGGIAWVWTLVPIGYYLGDVPFVKQHFEKVIIGVIVLSVLPLVWQYFAHRREKRAEAQGETTLMPKVVAPGTAVPTPEASAE